MSDPVRDAVAKAAENKNLAVIDFTAPWCSACEVQEKILDEMHERIMAKSTVTVIDLENHPSLAEKYDILSLPSLFLFTDDGKEAWRSSGKLVQADELLRTIESLSSAEKTASQ